MTKKGLSVVLSLLFLLLTPCAMALEGSSARKARWDASSRHASVSHDSFRLDPHDQKEDDLTSSSSQHQDSPSHHRQLAHQPNTVDWLTEVVNVRQNVRLGFMRLPSPATRDWPTQMLSHWFSCCCSSFCTGRPRPRDAPLVRVCCDSCALIGGVSCRAEHCWAVCTLLIFAGPCDSTVAPQNVLKRQKKSSESKQVFR